MRECDHGKKVGESPLEEYVKVRMEMVSKTLRYVASEKEIKI